MKLALWIASILSVVTLACAGSTRQSDHDAYRERLQQWDITMQEHEARVAEYEQLKTDMTAAREYIAQLEAALSECIDESRSGGPTQ